MNQLCYSIWLQFKLDLRNKNVLIAYYILPLVFFGVMGAVFTELNPTSEQTLVQSMTVLAISMAAYLGTPAPLVEFFAADTKKTYKVGNIPLWVMLLTTYLSALIHMLIVAAIIYLAGPLMFDAARPNEPITYFLTVALVITVATLIGMGIGLVAKKNTTMTMISQLFFLPSMLLSGIMFPSQLLPSALEKVGRILPATHSIEVLNALDGLNLKLLWPIYIIGVVALFIISLLYRKIQVD